MPATRVLVIALARESIPRSLVELVGAARPRGPIRHLDRRAQLAVAFLLARLYVREERRTLEPVEDKVVRRGGPGEHVHPQPERLAVAHAHGVEAHVARHQR